MRAASADAPPTGAQLIERLGKPAWIIDDMLEIGGTNALAHTAAAL